MITVAAKSCQSMVEMNVWRVCEVIVDLVGRARKIEKAVEKGVVWEMDGGGRCLWVLNSTKKKKIWFWSLEGELGGISVG